jgi:hypothetical protein
MHNLPAPLGQLFCGLPLGGGSNRLQTFVFAEPKNRRLHIMSSDGRDVERGGNGDDGGARRAICTEDGRWRLTAAVDDEGGGRSMAAGAFYVGNNGRLQDGADTTIK